MLLALTNSDEKEVSEISHEKRREWYHFILDRRMVLLGVEDLEQARALSVMKNLIAVKTKDSETIRDVHYKLLPGASSVDDKVAMLKGLKELEFNHRDPIFPIDAGVVFDAFADLYNNEELAKKKVFMQLAEHWELFIVQETISIHSFNKLLRYVAIHASLEQGGRALAKLAIALASVIGTEREAKEAPLLLDKILFFAWRIGADVGQFAPRPLSFGPATDNDRNAIVQLANAYGQNPVKSKPLETALVQLLLLQENPFETVWEAKPAEGGRSVGELVGTGHYGQPIVVHRAFLEAELQRMKYPHSPAHFMDYDEAAKMWKANTRTDGRIHGRAPCLSINHSSRRSAIRRQRRSTNCRARCSTCPCYWRPRIRKRKARRCSSTKNSSHTPLNFAGPKKNCTSSSKSTKRKWKRSENDDASAKRRRSSRSANTWPENALRVLFASARTIPVARTRATPATRASTEPEDGTDRNIVP